MADDARTELFRSLTTENSKYTYFLLTAAGAAIGFSLTQTKDVLITPSIIPLALAVLLWGISFFAGCRHIRQRESLFFENYQFLRVQAGDHPELPAYPEFITALRQDMEERRKYSGRWGIWQFRFLITGAIFYIIWHVLKMYLHTYPV